MTSRIALENGQLVLHLGHLALPLRPAYADAFVAAGESVWVFDRDASGKVVGLGLWQDRARDMRFRRE